MNTRTLTRAAFAAVALAATAYAANELAVTTGWTYSKSGRSRVLQSTTAQHDISGSAVIENVQTISTNATGDALVMGGVTDAGFAYFDSLSTDTNRYVEIGLYDANTNFVGVVKLLAGQRAMLWLSTSTPRARANGGTVDLDYMITDR